MIANNNSNAPLISVILPVYNADRFLSDSIESILSQSVPDFEFIIINDGSTDNSPKIIRSYLDHRIRIIDNERNRGQTYSLNAGLNAAKGLYIARQDADDLSAPNRFDAQVDYLNHHTEIALLGSSAYIVNENGNKVDEIICWHQTPATVRWALVFGNAFVHTSLMFRRQVVWEEHGGYAEGTPRSADYELVTRIAAKHEVANLKECLVSYRINPHSVTFRQKRMPKQVREAIISKYIPSLFLRMRLNKSDISMLVAYSFYRSHRNDVFLNFEAFFNLLNQLSKEYVGGFSAVNIPGDFKPFLSRQYGQLFYFQIREMFLPSKKMPPRSLPNKAILGIRAATRSIILSPISFIRQVIGGVFKVNQLL